MFWLGLVCFIKIPCLIPLFQYSSSPTCSLVFYTIKDFFLFFYFQGATITTFVLVGLVDLFPSMAFLVWLLLRGRSFYSWD